MKIICGATMMALASLLIGGGSSAMAQCDDKCPPISLTVYDFDATSLQPAATTPITDAGIDFMQLYFAAPGFLNAAFTTDPMHGCLSLFDASLPAGSKTVHLGDSFHPLLPGADGGAATDYLVSGKISGGPGAYTLAVSVLDSKTQEEVTSSSVTFASAGDALTAGGQAEAKLAPLAGKIRAFQKQKRDAGDTTAIGARFTVIPAKTEIKIGEHTTVKLVLTDCDGTVLKNRKVTLSTDGPAKVTPTTVTTNDQGEATATVIGGGKAGPATITASYPYTSVTHHQCYALNGWTSIQVGDAPSGLWEVRLTVSSHYSSPYKSETVNIKEGHESDSDAEFGMVGWCTVHAGSAAGSVLSTDLIAVTGGGNSSQTFTSFSRVINESTGNLITTSKANNSVFGFFEPGKMAMNSLSFVITAPYKGNAKLGMQPIPGTVMVAINGLPEKVTRLSHFEQKYYGPDARPPLVKHEDDTREETNNQVSASGATTAQMLKSQRYTIKKTEPATDKSGGTGETVYTITLRPINLSQTPAQIRSH